MRIKRKNDLNLRLLEIFGAAMRNQTTISAAEELGISQPAVSNALKALENQLKMTLFERTSRGLIPTDEAMLLHTEVGPIFKMMRGIEEQIRAARDTKIGRLRITATPPLSQSIIPIALKNFLAERKDVRISYDIRGVEMIVREIETGATDLGLLLGLESHPSCTVIPLHEGQMECMLPADHPLAGQETISPADIAEHTQIGLGLDPESKLGALVRAAFAMERVRFETNLEVRYCHTACVLANAGLGVAVVDSFTARFMQTPELVCRRFQPRIPITACAVVREGRAMSRITVAFIEEIKSVLAEIN
ncbi:MAG: LysR family transcriptional regulator [Hyphomicrobiales bacterium]|nr:LysR family transcriptional regulator [Hyphomicrobiales bacterium]MCP4997250.1 LysR family transcriptional regulator [Hyphomicrobiales bacterium]